MDVRERSEVEGESARVAEKWKEKENKQKNKKNVKNTV